LPSPGTSLKKNRRKTLPEFPDHIWIDIESLVCNFAFHCQNVTEIRQEFGLRCPLILLSTSREEILFHDYNTVM
jgi:hypothetical protein